MNNSVKEKWLFETIDEQSLEFNKLKIWVMNVNDEKQPSKYCT